MDRDHTATAVFSGTADTRTIRIDSVPRIGSIIVDGRLYLPSEFPLVFEWAVNSSHEIMHDEADVNDGAYKRYSFEKWTDLITSHERTIVVQDDLDLKALYAEQYYLKIISERGQAEGADWYNKDDTAVFGVVNTIVPDELAEGHRYVFAGWDMGDYPNSATNSIVVDGPLIIRANWKDQYLINLSSSIEGANISGGGWYDKGETAVFYLDQEIESEILDTKYVFDKWSSVGNRIAVVSDVPSSPGYFSIIVDNPYNLEAQWKNSFNLAVLSEYGSTTGGGYYTDGSRASISVASKEVIVEPNKTKLVFDGWQILGDGSIDNSQTAAPLSNDQNTTSAASLGNQVQVSGPLTLVAKWKPQYYLDASSPHGTVTGSGWYDVGKMANVGIDIQSKQAGFWVKTNFEGWSGDLVSESATGTIAMNGPKTVKAVWAEDYSPVFINGSILVGAGIGAIVLHKKFRSKPNAVHDNGESSALPLRTGGVFAGGNGSRRRYDFWNRKRQE
jgi:hypothetical protein